MLIRSDELQLGDEFLYPANGHLRYYKVIREPRISKKHNRILSVYASVNCDVTTHSYTAWNGKPRVSKLKNYKCTSDNHNYQEYVAVGGKGVWLIKREI